MSEEKIVTCQGRIVWTSGDLFAGRKKLDMNTRQPRRDQQGNEMHEFGFGLSIGKIELNDPNKGLPLWTAMHEAARSLYPSGNIPPGFAMKYKDGDTLDDQGRPFALREGYAGCLVFAMVTSLNIRFFRWEGGQNIQVADGIKCGDYVNVQVAVKPHAARNQTEKAGLYLNPRCVQLVAPGKEIINVPSGDQVFGMAAPVMPANYIPPEQPGAMPMPGQFPAAPMAPQAPQQPAPMPNYGVLPPSHQPPAGGMPMPGYPPNPMGNGFPAPAAAPMNPQAWAQQPGTSAPMASGPVSPAYPTNPGFPPMPGVPRV